MLIARAPVRISFAGGGTDLPAYSSLYGGAVISSTINKYYYISVNNVGLGESQIIAESYHALFENTDGSKSNALIWNGNMALPNAIVDHFNSHPGERIIISSDVPPGTGLGTSSAAAVALITALARQRGLSMTKKQVAELSCQIEIEKLRMPIGRQDQYASALGGLNLLEIKENEVKATPVKMSASAREAFQARLMLFFTGISRRATGILNDQNSSIKLEEKKVLQNLHFLKESAYAMYQCLTREALDDFGKLLDEAWQFKKSLSPHISDDRINNIYEEALEAGAAGGKITGAGGGGYLLLYCHPDNQRGVTTVMEDYGFKRLSFKLDNHGAHVLLDQRH